MIFICFDSTSSTASIAAPASRSSYPGRPDEQNIILLLLLEQKKKDKNYSMNIQKKHIRNACQTL